MNLPTIPQDKALHILAGLLVFIVATAVLALLAPEHGAGVAGVLAAGVAGIAKEVADYAANLDAIDAGLPPPHGVELLDVLATLAGGVLGWLAANAVPLAHALAA